jgi:hypothetical protein
MTRRRWLLVAAAALAAVSVVAAALLYRSSHQAQPDCDTVHAMLADNKEFGKQAKDSAAAKNPDLATADQYLQWAARMKDYAATMSDPRLSGYASTAADLAGRLADLVPKYRAKPDDAAVARQYAEIGIQFGNTVNRLEYACPSEA